MPRIVDPALRRVIVPALVAMALTAAVLTSPRIAAARDAATGPQLVDIYSTAENVAASYGLTVGGTAGGQKRMLLRLIIPVQAGDILDMNGRARITNDVGRDPNTGTITGTRYTVGVGYWLDSYDLDDGVPYASKVWTRIGAFCGDNVTVDRHHMPMVLAGDLYQVPAGWPAGHRLVVVLRADAHSTQWAVNGGGDHLTVDDPYSALTARQYREG